MKKFALTVALVLTGVQGIAAPASYDSMGGQMVQDCVGMSPEMQQFAGGLSASNKLMFCNQFTNEQRTQAVQMASKKDVSGKPVMTEDQAVQKVATDNKMTPSNQKAPSGCPVK